MRCSARRVVAVALTALSLPAAAVAVAAPAAADTDTTLTVLGTSDVSDSFLVQSVIKPGFQRAYPGVTLNYVASGTGQAITAAEAGQGSALIVHAASLENQFVAGGYSLGGAGRAVFYGDYVLAGPAGDPAGVLGAGGTPSHDIVTAFEKIAAAGAAGKATFVSRGGTPGTTVAEHSVWPLSNVPTCTVSDANGGGTTPVDTAQVPAGSACPATVPAPSWYKITGLKQGANVQTADTCANATFPNGGCYVFTDRGTFQYLESQALLKTLKIAVRDNDSSARGGSTLLTNSFHAYAIDPAKFAGNPDVHLNSTAATAFLDYLTRSSTQDAIGAYLSDSSEGAPFLPDAAPTITASAPTGKVTAGQKITITGSVRNVVPGTPALSGVPVSLRVTPSVQPNPSFTGTSTTTDANGNYTLSYAPVGLGTYTVATGSITKVERADLTPAFSDVLAPGASDASDAVVVQSYLTTAKQGVGGKNVLTGAAALHPADGFKTGQLQLFAARYTSPTVPTLSYVASLDIPRGTSTMNYRYYLPAGRYYTQLRYVNDGVVLSSALPVHIVVVS